MLGLIRIGVEIAVVPSLFACKKGVVHTISKLKNKIDLLGVHDSSNRACVVEV